MHQQIFQSRRVFMILLLGVLSGSLAGAQEFKEYPSSARDEKGKIIRSGYITNEWYDTGGLPPVPA